MGKSKEVVVQKAEEVALTLVAQQICDLLLSGYKIPQISEKLSLSRRDVRRHLVEVNRRVIENGLLKRDYVRAQVYTDYDHILAELEDAWEDSKPKEVDDPELAIELAKSAGRKNYTSGDARYLQLALEILKSKRQMLGLDAPKQSEDRPTGVEIPAGEDYVVKLHERFVTIKKNMARAVPATPAAAPEPIDTPFTEMPTEEPPPTAEQAGGEE